MFLEFGVWVPICGGLFNPHNRQRARPQPQPPYASPANPLHPPPKSSEESGRGPAVGCNTATATALSLFRVLLVQRRIHQAKRGQRTLHAAGHTGGAQGVEEVVVGCTWKPFATV